MREKSRSSLRSFFTALLIAAFTLNWIWEMGQMSAYARMVGRPWGETALVCTVATAGDVGMTFAIYAVGALSSASLRWGMSGKWNVYVVAAILGFCCAVAIEWRALVSGHWSYSNAMPIIPVLKVGLWPLLQLSLLVPGSLWAAYRWSIRREIRQDFDGRS